MANAVNIEIRGIGPVLFERSQRARRVTISVKPFRGVRVAVPDRVSFKKAEELLHSKIDWIKIQLQKVREYEKGFGSTSGGGDDIDRAEAKSRLTARVEYLAGKHGFTYNRVFVRHQRTRWGSCSQRDNISLNMKLVLLPGELMDYVILHELVHTRRKDHSEAFWRELDKLVGNGKEMSSRLKKSWLL